MVLVQVYFIVNVIVKVKLFQLLKQQMEIFLVDIIQNLGINLEIMNLIKVLSFFSLINATKKPLKFDQNTVYGNYSVLGSATYGPTFGGGHDFYICDNSNTVNSSYSNFGYSFTITSTTYAYSSTQAQSFLAGSYNFKTLEIEVFARN